MPIPSLAHTVLFALALAAPFPAAAQPSTRDTKLASPIIPGVGVWFGPGWYLLLKGNQGYLQLLSLGGPFDTQEECTGDMPTEPDFAKYGNDLHCFYYAKKSDFSRH